jgi:hypothetical protein
MDWIIVYDFGKESIRIWWMLIPVSIVISACGMAAKNFRSTFGIGKKICHIVFDVIVGTLALVLSLVPIYYNFSIYRETKKIYESKQYKVVEGIVENFHPMPYSGHSNESFTVNGIKFSYSDFDVSYYGFNNTQSHGGPISQNKKVRLSYFVLKGKNIILKIGVPKS